MCYYRSLMCYYRSVVSYNRSLMRYNIFLICYYWRVIADYLSVITNWESKIAILPWHHMGGKAFYLKQLSWALIKEKHGWNTNWMFLQKFVVGQKSNGMAPQQTFIMLIRNPRIATTIRKYLKGILKNN
jgi:hypothetical protein